MVASLAPDVIVSGDAAPSCGAAVWNCYQTDSYVSKVLSKIPATGASGPSDTLSRPEQSRNGIEKRVAQRAPHPSTGRLGPQTGGMQTGTGAGPHATGAGGGGHTIALGFTLVIGRTGGGAHTGAGLMGGGHIAGPQKARRRGKIGGGGSRIADATRAGQPSTVPQIAEQIFKHAPNPNGRGPQLTGPQTAGAA